MEIAHKVKVSMVSYFVRKKKEGRKREKEEERKKEPG